MICSAWPTIHGSDSGKPGPEVRFADITTDSPERRFWIESENPAQYWFPPRKERLTRRELQGMETSYALLRRPQSTSLYNRFSS